MPLWSNNLRFEETQSQSWALSRDEEFWIHTHRVPAGSLMGGLFNGQFFLGGDYFVWLKKWLLHYAGSFSFIGLVFATLFFSASVTPSLLPRNFTFQGLLSGFAIAVGYGIGVGLLHIYEFFQIPEPTPRIQRKLKWVTTVVVAIIFIDFLRRMTYWQNSLRELMEMEPVESAYPVSTALIAVFFGLALVAAGRFIRLAFRVIARKLKRFLPPRVAYTLSMIVVALAIVFVGNGVIAKGLLNAADAFFLQADALIDEGVEQPTDPMVCGSDESLIAWDTIGRRGKDFIALGPKKSDIDQFWQSETMQPIRVYAGMRSAITKRTQARLAVEELIRVGGFDRSVLVVATPTGTGWLDPGAVDSIEYMHRGDTAIVSTQYSYLPSWITILVDPERSIESARYLFEEVYDHWKTLPHDSRPKLYLQGLSLGSLGSELSAAWYTILEDPYHGAVWSGPPFPSRQWSIFVQSRKKGTPAWLPEFGDGSIVRFTAQRNSLDNGQRWGPIRNVYIQYASDPMVFFSPDLLVKRPEWLQGQRGPDVSPDLNWYPVVTFLKIAFDLPMAISVPAGYGHNYAPAHYIDAWAAVTEPQDWTPERSKQLTDLIIPLTPL